MKILTFVCGTNAMGERERKIKLFRQKAIYNKWKKSLLGEFVLESCIDIYTREIGRTGLCYLVHINSRFLINRFQIYFLPIVITL